jgi:hypothetical protein
MTWFRWGTRRPQPWLTRAQHTAIKTYHTWQPADVVHRIFIKDNGASSWVNYSYPRRYFLLHLLRRFEIFPKDWEEVTRLMLGMSGLGEQQCARVLRAVTLCTATQGYYALNITPYGFTLVECIDDFHTVVRAEETF